jgi:hypothetical protein
MPNRPSNLLVYDKVWFVFGKWQKALFEWHRPVVLVYLPALLFPTKADKTQRVH